MEKFIGIAFNLIARLLKIVVSAMYDFVEMISEKLFKAKDLHNNTYNHRS